MASVEVALATLRNELGTGHGRPASRACGPGTGSSRWTPADTYGRCLVSTLRDLTLI